MSKFISIVSLMACLLGMMIPVSLHGQDFKIGPTGIGPVKLGVSVNSIPKSVPGLYDKLVKASRVEYEDGDEFTVTVYQGILGKDVVFEFPAEEKVDDIYVFSKTLKTAKGLGLSSTPAALFSAGGTVLEGNDGILGILCEGVLFVGTPFTSSGNKKAEQSYLGETVTFAASDFVAGSHPEKMFIASWL